MKTVLKLAIRFLQQHPFRLFLTVCATAAATCLVLWVVSGYEAILRSYDVFANRALGRYALSVDPISRKWDRQVLPEIVEALRNDPDVIAADRMWAERVVVQSEVVKLKAPPPGSGSKPGKGVKECLLLGTDALAPPFDLLRGRWIGQKKGPGKRTDPIEVAVSAEVAERYGVDVNNSLIVGRDESSLPLRVVGIVDNPPVPITGLMTGSMTLPSPSIAGIYVLMEDAAQILKRQPVITFVGLCLNEGVDVHAFRFAWGPKLSTFKEPAQFQEDHDLEEQLDEAASAENLKLQSYAATLMALLLAFLVIFNTLNMGVLERTRQFAMLRAIALTSGQVARIVFAEGFLIASAGFIGGLAFGQALLLLTGSLSGSVLRHGAHLGVLGISLAAVASFGAAFLAALVPAWRATRVRPLDAMAPPQASKIPPAKRYWYAALIGLGLIGLALVFTFVFPPTNETGAKCRLLYALITLAMGFFLLAPAMVRLVDRFVGPLLARAIGISPKLLAQQLSCHMGRTVASAIALGVGLAMYVSIQVWGYTMLETFVPGQWAPDMFIAFEPSGLTAKGAEEVAHLPGIDTDRCAPIVVEQPRLRKDLTDSATRASVIRQDNVVLVGIDPQKAIGGSGRKPLLDFTYVRGTRRGALASMQNERGCIVPEHFLQETGLQPGDRFELVPPENPQKPVLYTIAASVRFQGWHWMTKENNLRVRAHRAAALVIADYETVCSDFDLFKAKHVWLRYETPAIEADQIADKAQGYYAGILGETVNNGKPKNTSNTSHLGNENEHSSQGNPADDIQTVSTEAVRQTVRAHAKRWLWAVSILPLVAVAIGCLGVLSVIVGSVRARQWEMGILRALGFTRGTLVRLVIAEGLLVGIVAGLLSLGFGIMAGWCGAGLSHHISFFGGMQPALVVPMMALLIGLLVVLQFAALAAIGPAIRVGRTSPLHLLQQGRSAL